MKPLRVLMLSWEWPPSASGGLGVSARALARALVRRGLKVSVLLPPGLVPTALRLRAPLEDGGVELIPSELVSARPSSCVPPGSGYGVADRGLLESYRAAAERVTTLGGFDCLHAHDWMTFAAAERAATAAGLPWIGQLHSLEIDRAGGCRARVHPEIEAIERAGLEAADLVLCVSHMSAGDLQRRYGPCPRRLRVLHGAVDPPPVLPPPVGPSRARPRLLYLGRFEYQKGVDLLPAVAAILTAAGQDFEFELVGAGSLEARLRAHVARLGLAERFRFRGSCIPEHSLRILGRADLVVMPSRREPFGLVALEAALAGRCVLIPAAAGVRELLPSAPTFATGDPGELAGRIGALLADPRRCRERAARLQREARGQHWDRRAAEWLDLCAELVGPLSWGQP